MIYFLWFMIFSSLGFSILVATGFCRLYAVTNSHVPRMSILCYLLFGVMITSFTCKTIHYNRVWYSRETLFRLEYIRRYRKFKFVLFLNNPLDEALVKEFSCFFNVKMKIFWTFRVQNGSLYIFTNVIGCLFSI